MEIKNKVLIIIMILIIIAGFIMVGFKGFNVSLYIREHNTLEYIFDQKFEKKDVKAICKEVFGDKKFEVRTKEVFDDSVYIIAESITAEEEKALLEKLVALYQNVSEESIDTSDEEVVANLLGNATDGAVDSGTTIEYGPEDGVESEAEDKVKTVDDLVEGVDYKLYHDSKIRLRDLFKPYILPTLVSAIIIIACMMLRYKLLKSEKVIIETLKIIGKSIVLLLLLLSIVAILRIPVNAWILPGMMFFVLVYIIVTFEKEIRRKDEETD